MARHFTLPDQTGNAGKFLQTNGTFPLWATAAGGGTVTSVAGANSIVSSPNPIVGAGTLQLVGDTASPGNSKYYGTDGTGTRGWYSIPGGGTIGGTIDTNQIAFGSALDTIDGDNNLTWLNSAGILTAQFGGNGTFLVNPSTGDFNLGFWTGGGNGMALKISDGDSFSFVADSGVRFLYDLAAKTYQYGDISNQDNSTVLTINDDTQFSGVNLLPADLDAAWASQNKVTPTIQPAQFLGTGLDDATSGGTYAQIYSTLIAVKIVGVDITVADPTGFAAFQSITDTTSGVTGTIQSVVGSVIRVYYDSAGIFSPTDSVTNGIQTTVVVSNDLDYMYWTEGINAGSVVAITGAAQAVGNAGTVTVTFGATVGHTGLDEWDIAVTANYIYTGWSSDNSERFWLRDDGYLLLVNANNRNLMTIDPNLNFYEWGNTFDPGFVKMDGSSGSMVYTIGASTDRYFLIDVSGLRFSFGAQTIGRALTINGTTNTYKLGDTTRWYQSMDADNLNFFIQETGGGKYLNIDRGAQSYGIGDLDSANNETNIVIQDGTGITNIGLNGSLSLKKHRYAVINGDTIGWAQNEIGILADPATNIAGITLTFPSAPVDGQSIFFVASNLITTVTLAGGTWVNGGTFGVTQRGFVLWFVYDSASAKWF